LFGYQDANLDLRPAYFKAQNTNLAGGGAGNARHRFPLFFADAA